jgi:nickel-dependent lactate racemase
MPTFKIPYGKTQQEFYIPDNVRADLILPNSAVPATDQAAVVRAALENPLNFDSAIFKTVRHVAIALNDKTRPVPHQVILPPLLDWLHANGIKREQIQFWIATGSHLPMRPDEFHQIIPQAICSNYAVASHNIDDTENLINLGRTGRGTPVTVNRQFYESDLKIVVGDIEPHHFAGFSGGYKSAAIGLAGRATINHNHAMLVDPNAWIAVYEHNPLRQDIEEIGQFIGIQLALNTILTSDKQVAAAVAGHPMDVMRAGIPISRDICGTRCNRRYPVVISSAGGSPKDINFYQAQKALTHASLFAEARGTLILVAECLEGTGSNSYEDFMKDVFSVEDVFKKFSSMEFRVGPHKAFQVARLLDQFSIILVSSIPSSKVKSLLMIPAVSLQEACEKALVRQGSGAVAVLPHATTTIPFMG